MLIPTLEALSDRCDRARSAKGLVQGSGLLVEPNGQYRTLVPAEKSLAAGAALLDCLEKKYREGLLQAYHADRDRIEALLEDILSIGPY